LELGAGGGGYGIVRMDSESIPLHISQQGIINQILIIYLVQYRITIYDTQRMLSKQRRLRSSRKGTRRVLNILDADNSHR
jgi:hypothetical protein